MESTTKPASSPLDLQIPITFFSNFAAKTKSEERFTMRTLAPRIQVVTGSEKSQLPWLKTATFGDLRTEKECLRNDANVVTVSGCEADYDAERMPFDEALATLERQGIAALAYTSPSHTEDAPRWRILGPFSSSMPPPRREKMLGRLNGLFGGIFSAESFTLSQSYYFGSVRHNPSHRAELVDGTPLDHHDDLDEIWIGRSPASTKADGPDMVQSEARDDAELIRCVVTGEHLHVELVALAARYIGRGIPAATTAALLRGLMLSHPDAARDERWFDRYNDIERTIESAARKFLRSEQPDVRRKETARLAFRLLRRNVSSADILAALHEQNRFRQDRCLMR